MKKRKAYIKISEKLVELKKKIRRKINKNKCKME